MYARSFFVQASAALACALLLSNHAAAQAATEFRDPARGVTFYSKQVSVEKIQDLQTKGGLFGDTDEVAIGVSAFFFDESEFVDDFVLWMRHDGPRRWIAASTPLPLTINVDESQFEPLPIHQSLPTARVGPFIERMEFSISPEEFVEMLDAEYVSFELGTLLGTMVKELTADELELLREFKSRVERRHEEIRLRAADAI